MQKVWSDVWKDAAQTEKGAAKRADTVYKSGQRKQKTGQTDQSDWTRPVQPVLDTCSTGFSRGIPGYSWLKPAELKFNSEVQLVSPAELESSAGQTSWASSEILN
jgi:hypothetical protein